MRSPNVNIECEAGTKVPGLLSLRVIIPAMDEPIKITTAAEYEQKALASAWEEPAPVTMPSGAVFLLRRPKAMWFALTFGDLPGSLAATVSGDVRTREEMTTEEKVKILKAWVRTFEQMFVTPEFREVPAEGQLGYRHLIHKDLLFLYDYANGGEVTPQGDLTTFRDGAELPGAGTDSGAVAVPAEPVAQ